MTKTKTKQCPYCKEMINSRAIICPHCQESQYKRYAIGGCFLLILFFCIFITTSPTPTHTTPPNMLEQLMTTLTSINDSDSVIETVTVVKTVDVIEDKTQEEYFSDFQIVLREILGESNRGVKRIDSIELMAESTLVKITWAIHDNLTQNFLSRGAERDVEDILETLANSQLEYEETYLVGTFTMVDKYGNINELPVIKIVFSRETIENINFENIFLIDIYNLADGEPYIHRDFR